jgi:hypothetical protein
VFVNQILAVASLAPEASTGGRVGNPIAANSPVFGVAYSPGGARLIVPSQNRMQDAR